MWNRTSLVRSCLRPLSRSSTTTPAINPKDYLKAWLGSDLLGNEVRTSHVTQPSAKSVSPLVSNSSVISGDGLVDTSLRRLSLISLQVDWSKNISISISNISPVGSRKLSCFLNMKDCTYSASHLTELLVAYKANGYEVIATNVPEKFQSVLSANDVNFVVTHKKEGLTLHPVPATHVQVTSTQIIIPTSKDKNANSSDISVENKLQVGTVRSGQQVYAEDCSLTVMGSVNEGAEIMSDGDIYVFGKLRGRAVAGLGAKDASTCRIYVTQFFASLVGIKDVFCIPEDHRGEYQMLKGRDVCITLEAKHPVSASADRGVGSASAARVRNSDWAAPICSIDCDDEYHMVFRPFLS